jgi:steroid 5-alpha reductase family enzyme
VREPVSFVCIHRLILSNSGGLFVSTNDCLDAMLNDMKHTSIVIILAALLALAGSQSGMLYRGVPVFALCALLAFALQWLAFVPAYCLQTEKFYDLTGSLTFISLVAVAWVLGGGSGDTRSSLIAACVLVWALRLGTFLFNRILDEGGDTRFDRIKPVASRFFFTWTLQGLWVLMTLACALAAMTTPQRLDLQWYDFLGVGLFVSGFAIEVVADHQKRMHRARHGPGQFIDSGLWRLSRHPNYLGEITLWCGIALLAVPVLSGWHWVTLVSPVFVTVLLTRISGIPLLERKADLRWGEDPKYLAYKMKTPVLVPRWHRPRVPVT